MLIFINGSINSGKSTVAEILQKKIEKCAVVEFDRVRYSIDWMPIDEALPTIHRIGTDLIKSFIKEGFNVIVPYPLLKETYDEILSNFKDSKKDIFAFTLNPSLEVVTKNRCKRKISDEEVKRIKYHYDIKINNPGYGVIIDNSNQSPEETAGVILNYINN